MRPTVTDGVLCDENVAPQTVRYLEREDHVAFHVRDVLELGISDPDVAAYAVDNDCVLLTNDADFLDEDAYPEITVLYFPNNRLSAYDLATKVDEATEYFPTQGDRPRTLFLS